MTDGGEVRFCRDHPSHLAERCPHCNAAGVRKPPRRAWRPEYGCRFCFSALSSETGHRQVWIDVKGYDAEEVERVAKNLLLTTGHAAPTQPNHAQGGDPSTKKAPLKPRQTPLRKDCALITALPKELERLRFHFRHSKPVNAGVNTYFESLSPSGLSLAGAVCHGMGQLNAAALTMDVIEKYNPRTIILTGIAGGLEKKIPLGDVVISSQIVDYELGKIKPDGLDVRWSVYPMDVGLLNKAKIYSDSSWTEYIRTPRPKKPKARPASHIGLYLSGNKVIADESAAGALRSFWRQSIAIEMEAAGIAAMLRQVKDPPGFLVIKGICDYADSTKNDDWQMYAADAAASYAYSFVTDCLTPEDLLSQHPAQMRSSNEGLRVTLAEVFSLAELKVLCFDLHIDWDEIAGERKTDKIVDLLGYCERNRRTADLIAKVNRDRDNILTAFRSR
jgi:nucleoside phosphorylase